MAIEIRMAGREDATLIATMSRKTFYDTFAEQNTKEDMDIFMNEVFTQEALEKESEDPSNIFLLAYDGGQAIGYVRMREGEKPDEFGEASAMEIARIYVEVSAIGKGAGAALMQASIDTAKELEYEWIWLGVWEKNDRAIRFYTQWGFEQFGLHDFILGHDIQTDWLMKKRLVS